MSTKLIAELKQTRKEAVHGQIKSYNNSDRPCNSPVTVRKVEMWTSLKLLKHLKNKQNVTIFNFLLPIGKLQ